MLHCSVGSDDTAIEIRYVLGNDLGAYISTILLWREMLKCQVFL